MLQQQVWNHQEEVNTLRCQITQEWEVGYTHGRAKGFEEAMAAGRAIAVTPPFIESETTPRSGSGFAVKHLDVRLPDGHPVVSADRIALGAGERVLVTGPSGSGKSTLFRAITGIWPFGSGRVAVPAEAKVMLVPQRPYFPVAPLAAAVAYPATAGTFDDARIAEAFEIVDAGIGGGARQPRQRRRERGRACKCQKFPAADGHAMSPRLKKSAQ